MQTEQALANDFMPVRGESDVSIRAALLPMFPAPILRGGLELQCIKTITALRKVGVKAELLDSHEREDGFDILHLFGSTHVYSEICAQAAGRWPIVVSAVCGGKKATRLRPAVWNAVSRLASAASCPTEFDHKRAVYRAASVILCLTASEAEFIRVTFGVQREKIRIVPNGVDDQVFDALPDLFVRRFGVRDFVLFTGNIVKRKNPLLLAQALHGSGTAGVFIGGKVASESAYAEEFARMIAGAPNLLWIPGLPHDDPLLASAYAAAAVFCLPSSAETQSLSALEAMAAGKPLIMADLLYAHQPPFEHSLKIPLGDASRWRAAIERVLADPAAHGRKLPDDYRWTAVARTIGEIYSELLGPGGAQ